MSITRDKPLGSLVLTKEDLKRIYSCLDRKRQAANTVSNPNQNLAVTVSWNGGSHETEHGFRLDDILDMRKSQSIEFRYRNYGEAKFISVRFVEGDRGGSRLEISGADEAWVDATFAEIERIVGAIRPQDNFLRRFNSLITIGLSIAIGYPIVEVLRLIVTVQPDPNPPDWVFLSLNTRFLKWFARLVVCAMFGGVPALIIISWARKLWPSIEFDFGPDHLKRLKRVRTRAGIIITLLVLPFGIEFVKHFVLGWN